MIKFKDAEITDILPYTFKTDRDKALSKGIKVVTDWYYGVVSRFDFWANISNVTDNNLLDTMAAELDTPFYTTDMPVDQKHAIIAAAYQYNSHIGTVGAVQSILNAAFGGGDIMEWFDYGGEPYHFRLNLPIEFGGKYISKEMIENFYKLLEKAKNKRSKLDEFTIEAIVNFIFSITSVIADIKNRNIVPAAAIPPETTIAEETRITITAVMRHNKTVICPARNDNAGYSL